MHFQNTASQRKLRSLVMTALARPQAQRFVVVTSIIGELQAPLRGNGSASESRATVIDDDLKVPHMVSQTFFANSYRTKTYFVSSSVLIEHICKEKPDEVPHRQHYTVRWKCCWFYASITNHRPVQPRSCVIDRCLREVMWLWSESLVAALAFSLVD